MSRRPSPARHRGRTQRGAASLVVVMVLFFIITLVAAYTSRNLLFEQRTSANQYRSTLAFETAEAGVEWALARLNDGRMNDNCTTAGAASTQPTFRERYLDIAPTSGEITVPTRLAGCAFNGATWVCDCPATGNPNPTVTYTGNGPFAAFWVRFVPVTGVATGVTSVVRMQVNACTRVDAGCLAFTREAQPGDGLATVWAMVALRSAMPTAPAAALTVRETFAHNGRTATITNTDSTSGGLTIHSGAPIAIGGVVLNSISGTPPALSISQSDVNLALPDILALPIATAGDGRNRMFNSVFGAWPATYLPATGIQPGVVAVDCPTNCSATDVNDAVLMHPGQPVYVRGGGELRIGAAIGTANAPVLIIADGNVEFTGAHTVYGVIYSRQATWELDGDGTIRGAAIAERGFRFDDNDLSIVYDRDVLLRVRNLNGTFVKVPGGWRDFQP